MNRILQLYPRLWGRFGLMVTMIAFCLLLGGLNYGPCSHPLFAQPAFAASEPLVTAPLSNTVRFAVIGDYGAGGSAEQTVAALIKTWQPDFVVTVGDNNYPDGAADTIDKNIGRAYHEYIYPYQGKVGPGAAGENYFFPALGNHDWRTMTCVGSKCTGPYLDYFVLPNNERYYDLVRGPVHLFFLDSDEHEPDGITANSTQANWLREHLAASTARWKLVILHHSPYSSGTEHGSNPVLQWPFKAWGADAVLSGHDHSYERLQIDGLPYFVNGLGGGSLYPFGKLVPGSQVRYNCTYGALMVTASPMTVTFQFIDIDHDLIDSFSLPAQASASASTAGCLDVPIVTGRDDVEEQIHDGSIYTNSTDLELVDDQEYRGQQVVGLRFQNIQLPPQVQIERAMIQFTATRPTSATTSLAVRGVASDNPPIWGPQAYNVSRSPSTQASVAWPSIPTWGEPNAGYITPDLKTIVQEVVKRPGWQLGDALAFVITGQGDRTAFSFEGDRHRAPRLLIKYKRATPAAVNSGQVDSGGVSSRPIHP